MSLYRQGLYERAVVIAINALQVAEQALTRDLTSLATSLETLAVLCDKAGAEIRQEEYEARARKIRSMTVR